MVKKTIFEGLEGTLVDEILKLMESGDFYKVENKLEDGFEIIGDATDFEKACITLCQKFEDKIQKSIGDSKEKIFETIAAMLTGEKEDLDKIIAESREMNELLEKISIVKSLLWNSIGTRFTEKNVHIAIFTDYKIAKKEHDGIRSMTGLISLEEIYPGFDIGLSSNQRRTAP